MRASSGFTVIETVLFLGITGLMVTAMIIGVGSSIGAQRYRDSVESFKSTLQQQYADLVNVYNDREGGWVCRPSGSNLLIQQDTGGSSSESALRGQARCDIVGRYMQIQGSQVRSYAVLAIKSGQPSGATDVAKLQSGAYTLGVSSASVATSQLEWGAKIAWASGTNPTDPRPSSVGSGDRSIALLFIRSPDSGGVYTFSSNTVYADVPNSSQLKSMIVESTSAVPGRAARLLCIDSDGMTLTSNRGIFIDARAADSSAIRVGTSADFSGVQSC